MLKQDAPSTQTLVKIRRSGMSRWWRWCLLLVTLGMLLIGCSSAQPPRGLAPGGDLVRRAIARQVEQSSAKLSQQLDTPGPELEIRNVKVSSLEPLYLARLATYHLQGTYDLLLRSADQETTQKGNRFDLYLQRQREGKTWRWLKREAGTPDDKPRWTSYWVH